MKTAILGISAFYHDSAACLLVDGVPIAAAQEERFSRKKNDDSFPERAIRFVLRESGISYDCLTAIAFYDKPLLKFERLLVNYHGFAPKGRSSFLKAMPAWIHEKLFMKKMLRRHLQSFGKKKIPILFPEHHLSHASSAFFPSPFEDAAILTVDGVGEWATTTICHGAKNSITIKKQLDYPHSLGLLYAAFTYYLGFKVNSGEYKVMGLAPYGNANDNQVLIFKNKILEKLVDLREDGSLLLNMEYFDFATSFRMTNDLLWEKLFGFPARVPESEIRIEHMNLAMSIQQVTEMCMVALARTAKTITGSQNLVLAGGVALNCVANSRIAETEIFENIWIQPAAGDAGGSIGSAYAAFHIGYNYPRIAHKPDMMNGAFLGPSFTEREIDRAIQHFNAKAVEIENFDALINRTATLIAEGNVVGWFQDRMEFGPRALGNRSILGDPRNPKMQKIVNHRIKFREAFRPFAPAVIEEDFDHYFENGTKSPYMLFVNRLKKQFLFEHPENEYSMSLSARLNSPRSLLPAITHLDYTSRVQIVQAATHPKFWKLIKAFKTLTSCGMLINTSFNVRGEPIVCSPEDAYLAFMNTNMDILVMGNFLLEKKFQPVLENHSNIRDNDYRD